MRILLSADSKRLLFNFLKEKNQCNSYRDLSKKLNLPFGTFQNWLYDKSRYIPSEVIPKNIRLKLNILDKQSDSWGASKGGSITYRVIVKKYGISEIRRRQSRGGKNSVKLRMESEPPIDPEIICNPLFLEFYGALLGDGWLSKLKYKNKIMRIIGICGHIQKDKVYLVYLKRNITSLFKRNPYIKDIPKDNGVQLTFGHANLFNFLTKELSFPIGKKENLHLVPNLEKLSFEKLKYVIRGLFDTDGCFYLDKTPANKPYPCISITMKEPLLMIQIYSILIKKGFKVYHYKSEKIEKLFLKGSKQLRKWMDCIGSSNPSKFNRMIPYAQVAQSGLEHVPPKDGVEGSNPSLGIHTTPNI